MVNTRDLSPDLLRRFSRIKLVALDVDGVLTDGGMYYSEAGDELKKFNTRDGKGLELLRRAGIRTALVTGEETALVERRATKLKVDALFQGVEDKLAVIRTLGARFGIELDEIAFFGDDINDLDAMRAVGLAVTVSDGMAANRDAAHYITRARGGEGAVRELASLLLDARQQHVMRAGILLLCRMGSSRLPGKALAEIAGRSALELLIERLRTAGAAETIVVCTSSLREDDVLEEVATLNGVPTFRGNPEDVVERMRDAARQLNLDIVVSVGADDLLSDPPHMDRAIQRLRAGDLDFVSYPDLPLGASPYGVTRKALERLCAIKTGGSDGWEEYFLRSDRFRVELAPTPDPALCRPHLRMTLDYPEDLEFFRAIFEELYPQHGVFTLRQVIDLLEQRPEITQINRGAAERWQQDRALSKITIGGGGDGTPQ